MSVTEKDVMKALRGVKDPELNLDLVVLGLVYDVAVDGAHVDARISLTSPMCPVAEQIVANAREAIATTTCTSADQISVPAPTMMASTMGAIPALR